MGGLWRYNNLPRCLEVYFLRPPNLGYGVRFGCISKLTFGIFAVNLMVLNHKGAERLRNSGKIPFQAPFRLHGSLKNSTGARDGTLQLPLTGRSKVGYEGYFSESVFTKSGLSGIPLRVYSAVFVRKYRATLSSGFTLSTLSKTEPAFGNSLARK